MTNERTQTLAMLAEARETLLITLRGLTDDQAGTRTTVSELTLGGLLRHLSMAERVLTRILLTADGSLPEGMFDMDQYQMPTDRTLDELRAEYLAAAKITDTAFATVDLDTMVLLPQTPYSPPEPQYWSARQILLHLFRETAQHAGHADIIRESLDGANTTAQLGEAKTDQSSGD
ncbi:MULTISPECIES: DinB family protein [unclassified Crossiella]|uniref:DinB family protein n=1 Tax=unclassified Crossiella TaxID=2620835 RepID=UPI001FFEE0BA|nr:MULTISPECIES: DinB family protein [unclassified Crossiella]MCK2240119.1 DinB family protein [Crossiella sp. S99.2]MCK2253429.1 DinB family protein [Crossiella sp. S99.1]